MALKKFSEQTVPHRWDLKGHAEGEYTSQCWSMHPWIGSRLGMGLAFSKSQGEGGSLPINHRHKPRSPGLALKQTNPR